MRLQARHLAWDGLLSATGFPQPLLRGGGTGNGMRRRVRAACWAHTARGGSCLTFMLPNWCSIDQEEGQLQPGMCGGLTSTQTDWTSSKMAAGA